MSQPVIKVEIDFEFPGPGGVSVWTDVTTSCSGQIATTRGRSRETDQYSTGTLTFTLRNENRDFDPSNTAGPYWDHVRPSLGVRASIDGVMIFFGQIDDLDVIYELPNICTVNVSCIDGLGQMAYGMLVGYAPASMTTGARIAGVASTLSFGGITAIDTGRTTLQAGTFNNIAGLDHIQTCARSEDGFVFVDRMGKLTFFDRNHVSGETSQLTFSDLGGTDIGYAAITQKSQSLLLYNQVLGTRTGGSPQAANDLTSQGRFNLRSLSLGQLENSTDPDVENLCQYLVGRYSQPDIRFDAITLELSRFNQTTREAIAALDLVQLITVKRTPPGSGSPTTIVKLSIIDGIAFSLDVSASTYQMAIRCGSVDTRAFFKLDDPVFGLLDSGNKLGY